MYAAGTLYVACSGGLQAVSVNTTAPSLALKSGWTVTAGAVGPPIIAGGLVWVAGWGNGVLYGLDPGSGAVAFSQNLGTFMHFTSPSAAGGRLFIANDNEVTALTIAKAPPSSATATSLTSSRNPSVRGTVVTFIATVRPAPDAGTISFTDGATIPGCRAVPVNPSGQASCRRKLSRAGPHAIVAAYSGDAYLLASRSPTLTQRVQRSSLRVSAVRLSSSSFRARTGTSLNFVLSVPATVVVTIRQRLHGHRRSGHCTTKSLQGKPCTLTIRRATRRFAGRAGGNRFRLRLPNVRPGSYIAVVIAHDPAGEQSGSIKLSFKVKRPHRASRRTLSVSQALPGRYLTL